ncbi:MAG: lactonase family protein [Chloroflexota bacterium]
MTSLPNQIFFAGSYANKDQSGIYTVEFNPNSGEMTIKSMASGVDNPSYLAVHPNGRFLYATSEVGAGAVVAFKIDPNTHTLKEINRHSTGGSSPCHLFIDHTNRKLIASNYGSGNAAIFPILPDGQLGAMENLLAHEGRGPNPERQEGPHAHSAIISPDNRFIIIADLGIDRLVVYAFNSGSDFVEKHGDTVAAPGAGPRHMVFHPNGRFLYVANELNSTVSHYELDVTKGSLTHIETLSTLAKPNPDSFVADIHLAVDLKHLYISNRGDNSLAIFEVADNGRITFKDAPSCGGNWPRNFALEPNGRFALIANRRSNQIAVMGLDNGAVSTAPTAQLELSDPSCIKFLTQGVTQ